MRKDAVVLILGAGSGTRLWPLTAFMPKVLLPVSLDKKFITFALEATLKTNYKTYILNGINWLPKFEKFIHRNKVQVDLLTSNQKLETGGELLQHINFLTRLENCRYFFIIPGDYFIEKIDFKTVIDLMDHQQLDICLFGCESKNYGEYIKLNKNGLIKEISTSKSNISSVGIYAIKTNLLSANGHLKNKRITTTELLNMFAKKGYRLGVFFFKDKWKDLGTWPRYMSFVFSFNIKRFMYL